MATPAQIAALTLAQIQTLTPAQIAAFNDKQKESYYAKKIKFFLEYPRRMPITNNDISEYLSSVYSRGGLKTTLNIDKFMASFEPGAVTSGDTSAFCANLFGFRSQLYRKLLARTEDNPKQCKEAGYDKSVGVKCIWCGEWILDFPECEHALPILMAASLLGFSTANADEIEKILEYGSSHRLCNQVKKAIALLKWDSAITRWKIDWSNVLQMYNNIAGNNGFHNNRMRYTLLRDGTPDLLSDNIQEADNPGYQSWSMPAAVDGDNGRDYDAGSNSLILDACNFLSNQGFHRNRPHIHEACRTIATRINLAHAVPYNDGNIQVAGSRKKKSKKKKQKGGVLTQAQINAPPLGNPADLRTYLSQGPNPTNLWDPNSVAGGDADLYFLARLVAIRDRLNLVNRNMGGDMNKIRMYMVCKIVLGPDVDMLVKELGGASPPDPVDKYNTFMKRRESLMKDIKKAITNYKKLGPENLLGLRGRITGRRNQIMITNTTYEELKQLIETRVDAHNGEVDRQAHELTPLPKPKLVDDCKIDIDHETTVTEKLPKFIDWEKEKYQYKLFMANAFPDWLDSRMPIHGGGNPGRLAREKRRRDGGDEGDEGEGDEGDEGDEGENSAQVQPKRTREDNPELPVIPHTPNLLEIFYTKTGGYKKYQIKSQAEEAEDFARYVLQPLIGTYAAVAYSDYKEGKEYPAYLLFNYLLYPSNKDIEFNGLKQKIRFLKKHLDNGKETPEQLKIAEKLVQERSEIAEYFIRAMELAAEGLRYGVSPDTLKILGLDNVGEGTGGEELFTLSSSSALLGDPSHAVLGQQNIRYVEGARGGSRKKTSKKKKPQKKTKKKSKKLNRRKKLK